MKVSSVAVPLVVVSLILVLVWGVSMATLKTGVTAVEGGLELLRLQMRVVRLQNAVLVHSQQSLERQLAELDALMEGAAASNPEAAVDADPSMPPSDVDGSLETASRPEWPGSKPRSDTNPAG